MRRRSKYGESDNEKADLNQQRSWFACQMRSVTGLVPSAKLMRRHGRCGAAAVHASFSQPNTLIQESVRAFYTGWYKELVTEVPRIRDGFVFPMEGPGLGLELLPSVFDRPDLAVRRSEA